MWTRFLRGYLGEALKLLTMEAYEFDPEKDNKNIKLRGFSLALGVGLFEGPFVEEEDLRRHYDETRFIATGPVPEMGDRICVIVYTWRNGIRRLISFRKANDREIRKYSQSYPSDD
jgi:uncharacterized protein